MLFLIQNTHEMIVSTSEGAGTFQAPLVEKKNLRSGPCRGNGSSAADRPRAEHKDIRFISFHLILLRSSLFPCSGKMRPPLPSPRDS